ncbi:MAG: hypothetical protein WAX80_00235 [Minisyncoccia bacterium]
MKKLLVSGTIASLLLPSLAFAAYNDVTLGNTTVDLSVNSITLNVSGSTATIESIEVGATTFTVTLQSGSSFEVTAPGLESLTTNQNLGLNTDLCTGSISKMGYVASSTQIIATITPSATLCASATPDNSGGNSSGGSSGGGGGGGSTTVVTPVTSTMTTAQAVAAIKAQLIPLIQQLILLLGQELLAMQASGNY